MTLSEIAELYRTEQLHPNWEFVVDNDDASLCIPKDRALWTKDPYEDSAADSAPMEIVWGGQPDDFMFELCGIVGIHAGRA